MFIFYMLIFTYICLYFQEFSKPFVLFSHRKQIQEKQELSIAIVFRSNLFFFSRKTIKSSLGTHMKISREHATAEVIGSS